MRKEIRKTELEATHVPWAQRLEKENIPFKMWGSAGPDFLLTNNGAILETKRDDSASAVKSGFLEILARSGDARFDPKDAPFIGVITPSSMYIWKNDGTGHFGSPQAPDIQFDISEKKQFVEYLKRPSPLILDDHLDDVLRLIYGQQCPDSLAALLCVLNLHKKTVVATNAAIVFSPGGGANERAIPVDKAAKNFIIRELLNKYTVRDHNEVRRHIRHRWSQYQPDGKKAGLGKYYTPEHLVDHVRTLIEPFLTDRPYVADLAAGCGAFLAKFEDCRIIGRDIDQQAVALLAEMGFPKIEEDNSLLHVNRAKLGLRENDRLVLVGNPPYNDTTSLNRRYGTNKKEGRGLVRDPDLRAKDAGIAFLRAFAKLHPDAIGILHPLSYLIKETNFQELVRPFSDGKSSFTSRYKLTAAAVFSSAEFGSGIEGTTPFPVVAALYAPGAMDYRYISQFEFPIFVGHGSGLSDTGRRLALSRITTIDGIIRKYPPTAGMSKTSDIGLYQYNIRDTNSLLTSGALSSKTDKNRIPVQFVDLWKYSYLNCYKRYFGKSFIFGNLSPIIDPKDTEDETFRDRCVIDTVMNNQNIESLNRSNPRSFVIERFLLNDFKSKAKRNPAARDVYGSFVDFWEKNADSRRAHADFFERYFTRLREQSLLSVNPD
ncbi:MAG: hypothetical protein HKL90_12985 [Elusimicrobia bacterium]|nr:hypothetical protein [Elusimicrobiota bacterium]